MIRAPKTRQPKNYARKEPTRETRNADSNPRRQSGIEVASWSSRSTNKLGVPSEVGLQFPPAMREPRSAGDSWTTDTFAKRTVRASVDYGPPGMYGPPLRRKRNVGCHRLVCANVYGLCWSGSLLARMECAALFSPLVIQSRETSSGYGFKERRVRPLCHRLIRQQTW
jgi:hypothetical protein